MASLQRKIPSGFREKYGGSLFIVPWPQALSFTHVTYFWRCFRSEVIYWARDGLKPGCCCNSMFCTEGAGKKILWVLIVPSVSYPGFSWGGKSCSWCSWLGKSPRAAVLILLYSQAKSSSQNGAEGCIEKHCQCTVGFELTGCQWRPWLESECWGQTPLPLSPSVAVEKRGQVVTAFTPWASELHRSGGSSWSLHWLAGELRQERGVRWRAIHIGFVGHIQLQAVGWAPLILEFTQPRTVGYAPRCTQEVVNSEGTVTQD